MMPPTPTAAPAAAGSAVDRGRARRLVWGILIAAAAVFYLGYLARHGAGVPTDSDSSGYFNVARSLLQRRWVEPVPAIERLPAPPWDPYFQQPLGYRVNSATATRVTTYPSGFPLQLALAGKLVGLDRAAVVVNLAQAVLAALLLMALARQAGLPWAWAGGGAALLLGCPLFLIQSLQPMSDVAAMVWCMAAIWLALLARRRPALGAAAGFAFALAVLVRPSDVLVLVPLAIALGRHWRAWLAFVIGGIPGAAFLAWYNHALYGAILTTGYGDVSSLFGARYVPHNILHFLEWIPLLLTPFVAVPAMLLPWIDAGGRLTRRLLGAWIAVIAGFYVWYFHSGEYWWYLRFLLPAFPALILAGLLAARAWSERQWAGSRRGTLVPATLLVLALAWQGAFTHGFGLRFTRASAAPYVETVAWMRAHAPANALVVQMQLSGCFTYYTDFTLVRWDLVSREGWEALLAAAEAAHRPVFATLYDFEEARAFGGAIRGDWRLITRIDRVSVWQLASAAPARGP
jgi:hypothetical protein